MNNRFLPVLVLASLLLLILNKQVAAVTPAGSPPLATRSGAPLEIRYADRRFSPKEIVVPAGTALELKVTNASREQIEFESFKLHRERVIEPGQTVRVRLPALSARSYDFFDDFHDDVAQGTITAR
jgi:Cupredoxin-like domain